jgi:hypothetical protein
MSTESFSAKKTQIYFIVLLAVAAGVVFFLISKKTSADEPATSIPVATTAPVPADQKQFEATVPSFKQPFKEATTDYEISQVRLKRKVALRNLMPSLASLRFTNWVGQVSKIKRDSLGTYSVAITLQGSSITVKTHESSVDDLDLGTQLKSTDPLYNIVQGLKEGQSVLITGTFFESQRDGLIESSTDDQSSFETPNFIARFESIKAL